MNKFTEWKSLTDFQQDIGIAIWWIGQSELIPTRGVIGHCLEMAYGYDTVRPALLQPHLDELVQMGILTRERLDVRSAAYRFTEHGSRLYPSQNTRVRVNDSSSGESDEKAHGDRPWQVLVQATPRIIKQVPGSTVSDAETRAREELLEEYPIVESDIQSIDVQPTAYDERYRATAVVAMTFVEEVLGRTERAAETAGVELIREYHEVIADEIQSTDVTEIWFS